MLLHPPVTSSDNKSLVLHRKKTNKDKEGSGSTHADAALPTSEQVRQQVALQKTINTSVLVTKDKEGSGSTHADAGQKSSGLSQIKNTTRCFTHPSMTQVRRQKS